MLKLTLTEEAIKELDYERYHHPHPRVQRKMEALLLKARGVSHHQIATCVGVCENTLRSYFEQYQTGGIEALKHRECYQPSSEMEHYRDSLQAYFKEYPPASIPEAVKRIEELTGLKRSPTQVGIFLQKLGLKRLKTAAVPARRDSQLQATFKKPSGQKRSGNGSGRMKERVRSSKGKEKDDETFPKLSRGDTALVSTSRA